MAEKGCFEKGCLLKMSLSYNRRDPAAENPALTKARQDLKNMDTDFIVQRAGLNYNQDKQLFYLTAFTNQYQVSHPGGEISRLNSSDEPPVGLKIVLLHFLLQGNNFPLRSRDISFQEIPDAGPYAGPFKRQAIQPLVEKFGRNPELLKKSARKLKASFIEKSDLGFTLEALPTVPLTYLVWFGDDELKGGASLVFDYSVITKLPTEDISFLGEYSTELLLKFAANS